MGATIDTRGLLAAAGPGLRQAGIEPRGLRALAAARAELADDTDKLLVEGDGGDAAAVLLLSAPGHADVVERGARQARAAAEALGPDLGGVVLQPIAQGVFEGRHFLVTPWRRPLARGGWRGRAQRLALAPALLRWLHASVARTARVLAHDELGRAVAAPLEELARIPGLPAALVRDAESARARLERGRWQPRSTLAHMDLWTGNVLLPIAGARSTPAGRFYLIDWAAAELRGLPGYDLARLIASLRLPACWQRRALRRHARALGCPPADVLAYALAALGRLAADRGRMPQARWRQTAVGVHGQLARLVGA